ncbi:hypothetical protein ACQKE0_01710 [Shewanella colwelliana]|uniref:hypothetical protein n=1 Tax=Shewanella colwelliana TaxID=23 RepID=UPI003CFE85B6
MTPYATALIAYVVKYNNMTKEQAINFLNENASAAWSTNNKPTLDSLGGASELEKQQ